jgi:anti-sigma B factor antagonist
MEILVDELGGGRAAVRLHGRLDLVSARDLRRCVDEAVDAGKANIIVDLSGVTFVDSSGLGALIGGLKRARQAGGELRIAAPAEQVRLVLELTKLVRVLRPYETFDEALQGM